MTRANAPPLQRVGGRCGFLRATLMLCCCCLVLAAAQPASKTAHGNDKGKNKARVTLPVCAAGASTATTTYSCNTYGQNICDIATGQCALATNANLAKVAERTDCDFLASPADKGGCGLATREELSEFEATTVEVSNGLGQAIISAQTAIAGLATALTDIAAQLPPNPVTPPPTSTDPLCTRTLEYPKGTPKYAPFNTTAFTVWHIIPVTGGTIKCSKEALAAFALAVTGEAAKPDSCPLVPRIDGNGDFPRVSIFPGTLDCNDINGDGNADGKNLYLRTTLEWKTRFPCPASSFARLTSDPSKPNNDVFSQNGQGCEATLGCNPCRAAFNGGPSGEAICNAIYSAFPPGSVRVVASWTGLLRQSSCPQCEAAGDPYCSPDGLPAYRVGI